MGAIPKKVEERIKREIPVFQKILNAAHDRDVNEADTVVIVTDMLEKVFGLDKFVEVTREYAIKGTFVDLAVKIDGKLEYLIEVKAIGVPLKGMHLRQAVDYAAKEGIRWVVLTNGINWEIHRVNVDGQVSNEQVITFNFLEISPRNNNDVDTLFMLCRKGIAKSRMEDYYERQQACNKFVVGALLCTDTMTGMIRKVLRRINPGLQVTEEDIGNILQQEVIKRDVLNSEQGQDAQQQIKRALAKLDRAKTPRKPKATTSTDVPSKPE